MAAGEGDEKEESRKQANRPAAIFHKDKMKNHVQRLTEDLTNRKNTYLTNINDDNHSNAILK